MRRRGSVLLLALLVGMGAVALAVRRATRSPNRDDASAITRSTMKGVKTVDPLGPPKPGDTARRVYVGAYAIHVPTVDLADNAFMADLWIWFRWHGADFDPSRSFYLFNQYEGWQAVKAPIYVDENGKSRPDALGQGWFYQMVHVQSRFAQPFDVRRYPFDRQSLVIAIEDLERNRAELVYEVDGGTDTVDAGLDIPGWTVTDVLGETSETQYPTNFGDPRRVLGEDRFTRFSYIIRIARPVAGYLVTTLLPITIVVLLTFLAFLIPLRHFEARLSLPVTGLISAVALQLTASDALPQTGYVVLLDHVFNIAYMMILVTTAASITSLYLEHSNRAAQRVALDRYGLIGCVLMYFGSVAALVLSAA